MDLISVKSFFSSLDSSSVSLISEESKYCSLLVSFLSFLLLTPLVIGESCWWWDTGYLHTVKFAITGDILEHFSELILENGDLL